MKLLKCTSDNEKKYADFVKKHPNSLIYHTLKYRDILEKHLNCSYEYFILEEKNTVSAVMGLMYKDGDVGRVYNALPFFGSNGSILASNELAYKTMLKKFNAIISKSSFGTYIENPFDVKLIKPNYDFESKRICQVTDLRKIDLDNFQTVFNSKKRNDLRKAMRSDFNIFIDNSDNAHFMLMKQHKENMEKIGVKGKQDDFFRILFKSLKSKQDYDIFIAKKSSDYAAALLLLYHNDIVEYYTPVLTSKYRNLQPLSLIIYEAMRYNKTLGRVRWNWGGSGISLNSVYKFKKGWNSQDYEYSYFTKINEQKKLVWEKVHVTSEYEGFYLYPFELNSKVRDYYNKEHF